MSLTKLMLCSFALAACAMNARAENKVPRDSAAVLGGLDLAKAATLSAPIVPERIEISSGGVFVKTPITGLTGTACNSSQTYAYILFPTSSSVQEKLADRALSTMYYAQSVGKSFQVVIESCTTSYAVATWIYVN